MNKGVTRRKVALAALEIAAVDGLGAVTLRRLGARCGLAPMSLYTHISSRDDLVAAMVEQFAAPPVTEALAEAGLRADVVRTIRELLVVASLHGLQTDPAAVLAVLGIGVDGMEPCSLSWEIVPPEQVLADSSVAGGCPACHMPASTVVARGEHRMVVHWRCRHVDECVERLPDGTEVRRCIVCDRSTHREVEFLEVAR